MALAVHDDYGRAAKSLGYGKRQTYATLLSRARRAFMARWHEGEMPSRMRGQDKRHQGPGAMRDSPTVTPVRRVQRRRRQARS
jgi:hypothetical protein